MEAAADDATRRRVFAALWSCKEAFVKARGDGLEFAVARCSFEDAIIGANVCTNAQPVESPLVEAFDDADDSTHAGTFVISDHFSVADICAYTGTFTASNY